jgi:hypothetical protein
VRDLPREKGSFMPGNLADVNRVDEELRKLQPIVRQLLKEHFGVGFRSSGMTPHALNSQLESLIPHMFLATSPMDVPDLAQEVRSALTSRVFRHTAQNAQTMSPHRRLKSSIRLFTKHKSDFLLTCCKSNWTGSDQAMTMNG